MPCVGAFVSTSGTSITVRFIGAPLEGEAHRPDRGHTPRPDALAERGGRDDCPLHPSSGSRRAFGGPHEATTLLCQERYAAALPQLPPIGEPSRTEDEFRVTVVGARTSLGKGPKERLFASRAQRREVVNPWFTLRRPIFGRGCRFGGKAHPGKDP